MPSIPAVRPIGALEAILRNARWKPLESGLRETGERLLRIFQHPGQVIRVNVVEHVHAGGDGLLGIVAVDGSECQVRVQQLAAYGHYLDYLQRALDDGPEAPLVLREGALRLDGRDNLARAAHHALALGDPVVRYRLQPARGAVPVEPAQLERRACPRLFDGPTKGRLSLNRIRGMYVFQHVLADQRARRVTEHSFDTGALAQNRTVSTDGDHKVPGFAHAPSLHPPRRETRAKPGLHARVCAGARWPPRGTPAPNIETFRHLFHLPGERTRRILRTSVYSERGGGYCYSSLSVSSSPGRVASRRRGRITAFSVQAPRYSSVVESGSVSEGRSGARSRYSSTSSGSRLGSAR